MPEEKPLKPQPSLKGYNKWVVLRLMEAKGEKEATIAGWIIDRWIEENGDLLAKRYGITREQYQRQGNVIPHRRSKT